jgi:stage II sporulation protein D
VIEKSQDILISANDLTVMSRAAGRGQFIPSLPASPRWKVLCRDRQIQLVSAATDTSTQKAAYIAVASPKSALQFHSSAGQIKVNDRLYHGDLEIVSQGGFCHVINQLSIENYLAGVVDAEFSSLWNEESIAAQVVAARTYAYFQVKESQRKKSDFDLDATIKDQVYQGVTKDSRRAAALVGKTRGLVLAPATSAHSGPIKAFYHSTCGGQTELPERVWGGAYPGFKRQVVCPFCKNSPVYGWTLSLTPSEIALAIQRGIEQGGAPQDWPKLRRAMFRPENLLELRVLGGQTEQRVGEVLMTWNDQGSRLELSLSGIRFREWMGVSRFKSTWFQVQPTLSRGAVKAWQFQGRGNGHGVGMCQWGVKAMGEKGYRFASILRYYYPDAILKKMW